MAYHHAIDFGHTGTAPWAMVKLGMALLEHADMETAQAALQSAVDAGHPPVVAVASFGLGNLLARRGEAEAARAAFQRAIDSGYPEIAAAASLGLGGFWPTSATPRARETPSSVRRVPNIPKSPRKRVGTCRHGH